MTALLLASAPETTYDYVKQLAQQADFLVCADGGIRHAQACGLTPDLVIGDFDSGNCPTGCEVIALKPEKDDSDLMYCVRTVAQRGVDTIWIACASGGRLDHFLANLLLLETVEHMGLHAVFYDSQNRVVYHGGGEKRFCTNESYRYVGIIPLDKTLYGVTLRGMKYPLDNAVLHRDAVISISNEAVQPEYSISIERGHALVIESRDKT